MPKRAGGLTSAAINTAVQNINIGDALCINPNYANSMTYAYQTMPQQIQMLSDQWIGGIAEAQPINKCIKKENKNMNEKYFKVLKDTPAWKAGAILKGNGNNNGYCAVSDVYETEAAEGIQYYETKQVIEKATEWFLRVYPVKVDEKISYKTKEEAQKAIEAQQA